MKNKVQKLVSFTKEEWNKVKEYRFHNSINTQKEAITQLINLGLSNREKMFEKIKDEIHTEYGEALNNLATK